MKRVGFIGWRGMVGSVLMQRMQEENDFASVEPTFFSTSQKGGKGPDIGQETSSLQDAHDIDQLKSMDILVSCQGGDYTSAVFPKLREAGWQGYWIDAASTLRMVDDAIIILDPVNLPVIEQALHDDVKNYIGGNCTVSLMLMAVGALFEEDLVEWMSAMTYQAASGAGAPNMRELLLPMGEAHRVAKNLLDDPAAGILDIDGRCGDVAQRKFSNREFRRPARGSLIPGIDKIWQRQTREEWKGQSETNKSWAHRSGDTC